MEFSRPGQLVADMFCGSGTVPLEAALLGRRVFASDSSIYAVTLTKAKLCAPANIGAALQSLQRILDRVRSLPLPDLDQIPRWVQAFFHPQTLQETLRLAEFLKHKRQFFFLASLLGILHHQRPGFLSYPSSHLVPYLRTVKFPRSTFPDLYDYRTVDERLRRKVSRALKRSPNQTLNPLVLDIRKSRAETVSLPQEIDCVITSPPYMNALDYKRDNRLRLWFLGEEHHASSERNSATLHSFRLLTRSLIRQLTQRIRRGGYCIFVVGEQTIRGTKQYPSMELEKCIAAEKARFRLIETISDIIPDIRRSRRNLSGVKNENVLIYQKV